MRSVTSSPSNDTRASTEAASYWQSAEAWCGSVCVLSLMREQLHVSWAQQGRCDAPSAPPEHGEQRLLADLVWVGLLGILQVEVEVAGPASTYNLVELLVGKRTAWAGINVYAIQHACPRHGDSGRADGHGGTAAAVRLCQNSSPSSCAPHGCPALPTHVAVLRRQVPVATPELGVGGDQEAAAAVGAGLHREDAGLAQDGCRR